jgi:hypothetical protein
VGCVEDSHVCMQENLSYAHAHTDYAWIAHVHAGPTSLKVNTLPKNKNKCKKGRMKDMRG